jgi:hypothetical protein
MTTFRFFHKLAQIIIWMNVGEGGVFLFLKKSLNTHVSEHISDWIITASFKLENTKVVVVAVYFPSTNRSFDEYIKTLETLEQISLQYKNNKTNLMYVMFWDWAPFWMAPLEEWKTIDSIVKLTFFGVLALYSLSMWRNQVKSCI